MLHLFTSRQCATSGSVCWTTHRFCARWRQTVIYCWSDNRYHSHRSWYQRTYDTSNFILRHHWFVLLGETATVSSTWYHNRHHLLLEVQLLSVILLRKTEHHMKFIRRTFASTIHYRPWSVGSWHRCNFKILLACSISKLLARSRLRWNSYIALPPILVLGLSQGVAGTSKYRLYALFVVGEPEVKFVNRTAGHSRSWLDFFNPGSKPLRSKWGASYFSSESHYWLSCNFAGIQNEN